MISSRFLPWVIAWPCDRDFVHNYFSMYYVLGFLLIFIVLCWSSWYTCSCGLMLDLVCRHKIHFDLLVRFCFVGLGDISCWCLCEDSANPSPYPHLSTSPTLDIETSICNTFKKHISGWSLMSQLVLFIKMLCITDCSRGWCCDLDFFYLSISELELFSQFLFFLPI